MIVPCIVCRKKLTDIESGSPNHADDANEFRTYGQYGSTVFDPGDGTSLAVNICDECLVKAGHEGAVLTAAPKSRDFTAWKPR